MDKVIPVAKINEFSGLYLAAMERFGTPAENLQKMSDIMDVVRDTAVSYESKKVSASDIMAACKKYKLPHGEAKFSAVVNDFVNTAQSWC